MKTVTLNITQEIIDKHRYGYSNDCPIHEALVRAGLNPKVKVSPRSLFLSSSFALERCVDLPPKAQEFSTAQWMRQPLEPFKFELEILDWMVKP